ncbi:hypothetical protein HanIR_Chr15g0738131 [Helianthus annuus]|nr:hypothetical protein HanIR_Chr15g0738131 [Helianthus annuus]
MVVRRLWWWWGFDVGDMSSDEEEFGVVQVPGFDEMAGGDCLGILYMDYPKNSREYKRFNRLRQMKVGRQRVLSWEALREVGEEGRARGLIRENSPWDRMFSVAVGPSHRTMMVEFPSTFVFRPRPADRPNSDMDDPNVKAPPPEVYFYLFGQRQNWSLRQFAVATGFYTDDELLQDIYTTAIWAMPDDHLFAWWPTLGAGPFGKKARVSADSTKVDLFFLYCLYTGTPCALHRCLAEYFASYGKRQRRSRLIGGAFTTRIAQHCGLYYPFLMICRPQHHTSP